MDASQVHLALNHLPLILPFCGMLLLLVALIRKNNTLFRTGTVFLLFAALMAIPTYLSGEGAEEIVETFIGTNASYIEPHEEAAEFTFILLGILGAAAAIALIATRNASTYPKMLSILLIAMSLITFISVARTAHLGGQIMHPELRAGGVGGAATPPTEANDD